MEDNVYSRGIETLNNWPAQVTQLLGWSDFWISGTGEIDLRPRYVVYGFDVNAEE